MRKIQESMASIVSVGNFELSFIWYFQMHEPILKLLNTESDSCNL